MVIEKPHTLFGLEFYPTPKEVLEKMSIDPRGLVCLDPQAGKGDILAYCLENGAKQTYFSEINPSLATIAAQYGNQLGKDAFDLSAQDIAHVELIVMNPPFSNAAQHLLHMYEIAPDGCEIKCLMNSESRKYGRGNIQRLNLLVREYGYEVELGNCFQQSERQTDVEVVCVTLVKPITDSSYDFSEFSTLPEYHRNESNTNAVARYNPFKALVNQYTDSYRKLDLLQEFKESVKTCPVLKKSDIGIQFGYGTSTKCTLTEMKRQLKLAYWGLAIKELDVQRYMTQQSSKRFNQFISNNKVYPFSLKNIFKLAEVIFATRHQVLDETLLSIIDRLTRHTHENRYAVAGWKTNKGHLLNSTFIVDHIFKPEEYTNEGQVLTTAYSPYFKFCDLQKVLAYVTGVSIEDEPSLDEFVRKQKGIIRGQWYDWSFFKIKGFKKGTIHLKFRNPRHHQLLNQRYAELKGEVLPEKI